MCGYCVEGIGIQTIFLKRESPVTPILATFFLQEISDVIAGLDSLLVEIGNGASKVEQWRVINPHILTCRLIEVLVLEGFDAHVSKRMLQNELIQEALQCECLENSCLVETLENAHTCLSHFQNAYLLHRTLSETQLQILADSFPHIINFYPLYHIGTYFDHIAWKQFIEQPDLKTACSGLLDDYFGWWLKGGSLVIRGFEEIKAALNGTGVVHDSLMGIRKEDRLCFDLMFRALFFSLVYLDPEKNDAAYFRRIIRDQPAWVPLFDGMDLWLQRKAAQRYFEACGPAFFLNETKFIREGIRVYLAAKSYFLNNDREKFRKTLDALDIDEDEL